jgi:predicted permease
VSIIADLLFTSSLCIALSRMDSAGEHGLRHAAANALKGVLANPMPWAVCLGAVFSANEWRLPETVDKTLGLLADAASPVALFTIGAVLARSHARARMSPQAATLMRDYLPVAGVKLVLHPILVLLVGTTAIQMGVPLDPFALMVVVLVAALPSASNVSMLAERLDANNGRIAQIILVTTAMAFLTFSGAVVLLKP